MDAPFFEAVKAVASTLTPVQRSVLKALLFTPGHAASAGQLRTMLGFSAVVQVNAAMGQIGRKVQAALGAHPEGLAIGEYQWWHVVATGKHTDGRGFVWQLREEVVAGLQACGFATAKDILPNEVVPIGLLVEGAVQQETGNSYERNPKARARCIAIHGPTCSVCGFDFGAMYGSLASGFIHVHHIRPLSSIGAQYQVNPSQDLRPVCPNCHAVIHMTEPPRSIKEVQAMLALNVDGFRSSGSDE